MKSNSSFAITKKVAQSTGINHCFKSNFTAKHDVNLVVARSAVLQIYTLRTPLEDGVFPEGLLADNEQAKLYLSFETTLFSNIQAMAPVLLPGYSTDAIILCFADAKVSVVVWDPEKRDLSIISLHYFEKDAGLEGGVTQFVSQQQVIVDYQNRCACVLIYDEMLAVIPFVSLRSGTQPSNQTSSTSALMTGQFNEANTNVQGASNVANASLGNMSASSSKKKRIQPPSYLIHLPELGVSNIRDIKFLHGYYEPTIMVLYEPIGTWAGRLAVLRNTVSVAIIELDINMRRKMLIWSMDKLPHDSYRICPLKYPGGACIFSSNAIIFIDHSSKYRLSLNSFGDSAEKDNDVSGKYVFERSNTVLSLDNAQYTFLSDSMALLSIESGALYIMSIITDGRSVTHIDLTLSGNSMVTTGMCTLNDKYLFVAAKLANSLLLHYSPKIENHSVKKAKLDSNVDSNLIGSKSFGEIEDWVDPEDVDNDVLDLLNIIKFGKSYEGGQIQKLTRWDLKVVDHLTSVAPLSDYILRPQKNQPKVVLSENDQKESTTEDKKFESNENQNSSSVPVETQFDIVAASGYERGGAICVIKKQMPHSTLVSAALSNSLAVWPLYAVSERSSINIDEDEHLNDKQTNNKDMIVEEDAVMNDSMQIDQNQNQSRKQTAKRKAPDMDDLNDREHQYDVEQEKQQQMQIEDEDEKQSQDIVEDRSNNTTNQAANQFHKYLIVTQPENTMVLVEEESGIAPVNGEIGLSTEETLGAGNVLKNQRIVQVCYYDIIVVDSSLKMVQKMSYGQDEEGNDKYAIWCSVNDPFALILLSDNSLLLFKAYEDTMMLEEVDIPEISNFSSHLITTVQLLKDSNNLIGFNNFNQKGKIEQKKVSENMVLRKKEKERKLAERESKKSKFESNAEDILSSADGILSNEEIAEMLTDAIEFDLYGELLPASILASSKNPSLANFSTQITSTETKHPSSAIHESLLEKTMYIILAREEGTFEIWKIENSNIRRNNATTGDLRQGSFGTKSNTVTCVFKSSNLHNGKQMIDHENEVKKSVSGSSIAEICIAPVGSKHSLPSMIVKLEDGTIYAYTSHYFKNPLVGEHILPIRFVRVPLGPIVHNLPSNGVPATGFGYLTTEQRTLTHPTITAFYGLSGRFNGFFVAGDSPLWIFCERDYLRAQRVSDLKKNVYMTSSHQKAFKSDQTFNQTFNQKEQTQNPTFDVYPCKVTSFCPVNMESCPNGFVYMADGMMNLSTLDPAWDVELFGGGLCALRIPINETVHSVSYDPDTDYIILTTSKRKNEMVRYLKGAADDKKEADLAKKIAEGTAQPIVYDLSTLDPRLPPIWEDVYTIKLIDPETWTTVSTFALNPEEIAISKFMSLMNYIPQARTDMTTISPANTTAAARKLYVPYKKIPVLVVGTAIVRGEDAACRGRILVLDIIADSDAEDGSRRAHFEVRTTRSCTQPITALEAIDGLLLSAEGRQFYVYELRVEQGVYRVGFLDGQLSTVSLSVLRNYIVYGDIHHNIRLMRWLKAPHNWLQLVAKDSSPLDVVGTGTIVEGSAATFLASDEKGNIYLYSFTPSKSQDVCAPLDACGDFHYGTRVRRFSRYRVGALPKDSASMLRNHGCILAGQDGSVGYIIPVPSHVFSILRKLETHLVASLEHTAGLHPFAFRLPKPSYRMTHPHHRAVLDGDLLWRFLQLERTKQDELTKSMGINAPAAYIIDILQQFCVQSTFY